METPSTPISAGSEPVTERRTRTPWPFMTAVVAASLISATLASLATVVLVGPSVGGPAATPAAASPGATSSSPNVVQISASDAVVRVAEKVSPAVVTITASSAGTAFDPFSIPSTGVGSGFIYDAAGWILTNWHVVEGGDQLTVTLDGGRQLPGRVVASDPTRDLAIVKVDATGLPTAEIGTSADLRVGQLVVAIGSPLGTFTDSVTSGILSATGRTITVRDPSTRQRRQMNNLLQTDAAINEGNSGGPLLDAGGRVIGINAATAASAQGIGFAIPIDEARSIMESARTSGAGAP